MPEDLLELEESATEEQPLTEEATETPETPETPAEGAEKIPVTSLFQADGKKLDPQVSATLAKIKTDNPELGKLLTRAVYRVAELDREFPGGVTEAKELRDKVEEFGGVDGIAAKMESLEEMDGLAKAYMASDPKFIEDLIESSPEAFSALAPAIFQKFAEVNAEGFSAYMGRVVLGDMQANGLPLMMMRMQDLIPADNAKLKEAFEQVNGYLGGFKALADKPLPSAKAKAATGKTDDLSKREETLRAKEWQSERDTVQKGIVNTEYTKHLAGRKPDTEEKAQIRELFVSRSKAAADKLFPGWMEKAQRYISSGDKPGYLRYMKSIYARVVPEAMATSVKATMKGKAAVAAKKTVAAGGKAIVPAAGFKLVAKEPDTWDIDYVRTGAPMLRENRAVLKDGSKVAWK